MAYSGSNIIYNVCQISLLLNELCDYTDPCGPWTCSLTLSGSLWTSMKAEYSSIRSFEEAMVRSCHTGTAVADGGGGGAKGS